MCLVGNTPDEDVFQFPESVLGDAQLKGEVHAVGHHQTLLQRLHLIYEVEVDDEPLAYTGKDGGTLAQALGDELLHVTEVHAHGHLLLVDKNDVGIIPVALHIDNLGAVETNQFVAGVDVQKSGIHNFWSTVSLSIIGFSSGGARRHQCDFIRLKSTILFPNKRKKEEENAQKKKKA